MRFKHSFKRRAHKDLEELFEGVNKFSTLISRIAVLAERNPERYPVNDYKGDAFEFFVEGFLNAFQYDNRIGISDYSPNQINDNGVDGIGVNFKGEKSVVQVKFRTNNQDRLSSNKDHLGNLISDGVISHGVIPIEKNSKEVPRHYVFTSAKGLHYYTDVDNFKGTVKCFGYDDFRALLDNNINFWDYFRESISKIK